MPKKFWRKYAPLSTKYFWYSPSMISPMRSNEQAVAIIAE